MMAGAYTIRYRRARGGGAPALVVEDQVGIAYLSVARLLQVRISGEHASERLVQLLGGRDFWEEVPRVSPYSLEALASLLGCGNGLTEH